MLDKIELPSADHFWHRPGHDIQPRPRRIQSLDIPKTSDPHSEHILRLSEKLSKQLLAAGAQTATRQHRAAHPGVSEFGRNSEESEVQWVLFERERR
jgi:hypothetical protein